MHTPRKRFGQNFLTDSFIIQKIINSLTLSTESNRARVVEIGPGQGALTKPLVTLCNQLTVIEIDRDLIAKLQQDYINHPGLTIICADALKFDFRTLCDVTQPNAKLKIIGNLPYNISTPLLFHLFSYNDCIEDMHFMLQKEVVDRMVAGPNSKEYGRLSVMTQYFCHTQALFLVPPSAFFPAPKVESAIIRLTPHNKFSQFLHSASFYQLFDKVVKAAFSKRRKTLSNALKDIISKEDLHHLGINPLLRAENLDVKDYIQISDFLNNLQDIKKNESI